MVKNQKTVSVMVSLFLLCCKKQTQANACQKEIPMTAVRDKIRQHPERSHPEAVSAILSTGYLAHVAYSEGDQPYVIPMAYHYDPGTPDMIYLHGSRSSHTLKLLAQGQRVSIEVTQIDGLVYSRSAMHHSMNYHAVIGFGQGTEIESIDHKAELFDQMIGRYHPGRLPGQDYTTASVAELKATRVIAVKLDSCSAKIRQGGATGPQDQNPLALGSRGVIPLQSREDQWRSPQWQRGPYEIQTQIPRSDLATLFDLLKTTYWNADLSPERLQRRVEHSVCFGVYKDKHLIGFARLVTDHDSFAYLADVVIAPAERGQGLGKWLIQSIHAHPLMPGLRRCLLFTRDGHDFYRDLGYQAHPNPAKLMVCYPNGDTSLDLTDNNGETR